MRIRLLGRLELESGGRSLPLPRSRKTRALLGYLVATGEAHGRPWLCDLLWDGPADPRAALRWSLAKLRPLLDEPSRPRLVTRLDTVGVDLSGVTVDLAELNARVGERPSRASTDVLRAAAASFRGTFLEGLELDGCYRFDAWVAGWRERLHRTRSEILAELVRRLHGLPEEALLVALDRLAAEPFREDAWLDVARILYALGRTEEARRHLARARLMLDHELGVEVSAELLALERRIEGPTPPGLASARMSAPSPSRRDPGDRPTGDPDPPGSPAVDPGGDPLAAAQQAIRRGRPREAAHLLRSVLDHLDGSPGPDGADRSMATLELFVHPAMVPHRPQDLGHRLAGAVEEARRAGRLDLVRFGFHLIAHLHWQEGDFDAALHHTDRAAGIGRLADPVTVVRALADTSRCLGMLERHPDRARRLAVEAGELAPAAPEPLHEIDMALALVCRHEGRNEEALAHLSSAVKLIRTTEDDWWEGTCLVWKAMLDLERERPADALVTLGELRGVTWRREQAPETVFSGGLEALARAAVLEEAPGPALDRALDELRRADSRWMLAYLQLAAVPAERRVGRVKVARSRARDALEAARGVGRQNEVAAARAALAEMAAEEGAARAGRRELEGLQGDGVELGWLSARARTALEHALARLEAAGP